MSIANTKFYIGISDIIINSSMIKYASPFVPLADKTGLIEQSRFKYQAPHVQEIFESEYEHPIIGQFPAREPHPYIANETIPGTKTKGNVPMREVYDKFIQAQGFKHNATTGDPDYINKLNAYRSSPNSQLEPIPDSVNFSYNPAVAKEPAYISGLNWVSAYPADMEKIKEMRHGNFLIGNTYGAQDYLNNYNFFDRNDYNKLQTSGAAHEALGHAGNWPKADFYKPIAEREGKPVEEIVPIEHKFWPTYWGRGSVPEFTQSLHAAKRQGREWGLPVDSDNNEEVTQAFRDTFNRVQKMPLNEVRQLPLETQRLRAYLNNARQFNSYKEDSNSSGFKNRAGYIWNYLKSIRSEDQNNPQLMDQTTEDVLYYTTPETLKGLLASNNTQVNNYV